MAVPVLFAPVPLAPSAVPDEPESAPAPDPEPEPEPEPVPVVPAEAPVPVAEAPLEVAETSNSNNYLRNVKELRLFVAAAPVDVVGVPRRIVEVPPMTLTETCGDGPPDTISNCPDSARIPVF